MLKIWIIVVLSLSSLASPCIGGDVPFKLERGLIIISANIKGGPTDALVSTGIPESYVSSDIIVKRGIKLGYTNDGPVMGTASDKTLVFADVSQIVVGDEKPVSLTMKQRSLDSISKTLGRDVGLILGADYFKGKIIQIDFKANVIRFLERSPIDYKNVTKTPVAGSASLSLIFKMNKSMVNRFGIGLNLPVVEDVTFDGSKIRTLFDTGETSAPFAISPSAAKQIGLGPVPDKGTSKAGQIKSISLNGYQIDEVPVLIFGKEAGFDKEINDYGAILGITLLKNFVVIFDWKERMIVLQR